MTEHNDKRQALAGVTHIIAALVERSSFGTDAARAARNRIAPQHGSAVARSARLPTAEPGKARAPRLNICGGSITGAVTAESAQHVPGLGWTVSWLPGRRLTLEQAIAAIELAEVVADPELERDSEIQPWVRAASDRLGLSLGSAPTQLRRRRAEFEAAVR